MIRTFGNVFGCFLGVKVKGSDSKGYSHKKKLLVPVCGWVRENERGVCVYVCVYGCVCVCGWVCVCVMYLNIMRCTEEDLLYLYV